MFSAVASFFKQLSKSFKKTKRLREVTMKLTGGEKKKPFDSKSYMDELISSMASGKGKEDHFSELLDICHNDEKVQAVIDHFQASDEKLKSIYDVLIVCGAGQFQDGHYVAASSLVFHYTLFYILDSYPQGPGNTRDDWQRIAFRLVNYFRNGETGRIQ